MLAALILLFAGQAAAASAVPSATPAPADYVEYATQVSMTIGTDGRAKDCTVTRASGIADLDAKVCPTMLAKARFTPKSDAQGKPVEFPYTTAIKWRLPKEGPAKP
ncbi:energy transducer TonB [Sphingobium sp. H39-3-25]|uniref:energy transducer TonB n=1 Tax=Sphingobium arseniciresistens TaxID=3030834 RepID=UPI0023BA1C1B|nr:energy transducer TonB [Sphingobium arseniciresistens]